jgi:hypothetical protein
MLNANRDVRDGDESAGIGRKGSRNLKQREWEGMVPIMGSVLKIVGTLVLARRKMTQRAAKIRDWCFAENANVGRVKIRGEANSIWNPSAPRI